MKNSKKIEIAKDYVSKHRFNNVTNWQPTGIDNNPKYLKIYKNMMEGVYGEARKNDFGEMELEIGSHESKNGNPVIFKWEINTMSDSNKANDRLVILRRPFEAQEPNVAIVINKVFKELKKLNYWATNEDIEWCCNDYYNQYYACGWMDILNEKQL